MSHSWRRPLPQLRSAALRPAALQGAGWVFLSAYAAYGGDGLLARAAELACEVRHCGPGRRLMEQRGLRAGGRAPSVCAPCMRTSPPAGRFAWQMVVRQEHCMLFSCQATCTRRPVAWHPASRTPLLRMHQCSCAAARTRRRVRVWCWTWLRSRSWRPTISSCWRCCRRATCTAASAT